MSIKKKETNNKNIQSKKNIVWTTKRVESWMKDYGEGITHKDNPWLDGTIGVKNPNLVFEYTPQEIEELTKCAGDIMYFANNYCYCLHGNRGYQPLKLRDYQEEMLNAYNDNRFCVCCASRQVGKCFIFSKLSVLTKLKKDINIEKLYISQKQNKTYLEKIKSYFYKFYNKFNYNFILKLIQLIEKYEYRKLKLDENDISKKIIDTIDISNQNIQILSHDGYHKITHVHKTQPYHLWKLTLESGDELECADNHIIFCKGFVQKFVKDLTYNDYVMTKNGLFKVKNIWKSDYKISMYDISIDSKDHSYYSNNILSHNTVVAGIFLLHNAIFNYDKNIGIAANKFQTAVEIMDKIKEMMDYLPFFMKPGVKVNNQSMMVFANGCRIIAQATTKRSFIGYSLTTLFLDEFGHVEPQVLDEFYENIMPTVSSMEDSKIIITSTPNGYNKFYDIYQGAVDGRNSYHPIRVDWWQVPGRDEKWRDKMIHDCGGEDEFMRQYGNSFLSTGNTLLSPDSLAKLQQGRIKYKRRELVEVEKIWDDEYVNLLFDPNFDVEEFNDPSKRWIMSIDLAEGGGGDNSVLNMFRLQEKPKDVIEKMKSNDREKKKSDYFQLRQVGRFKSNTISLELLAKLVYVIATRVISPDNIRIVCEYNAFGGEFLRLLQSVFGDKNMFDMSTILKFKHSSEALKPKYGLKVRSDNKPVMCITLKGMIADDSIIVTDDDTVSEFEVFSKSGNSWKASRDHDDLAMSVVDLTAVFEHPYFEVMMEEIMGEELRKEYEDEMDEKFGNMYDNYMNMNQNIFNQENNFNYPYHNEPINTGYFGNKGLYS